MNMKTNSQVLLNEMDRGRFEMTEDGILMPDAGVLAKGQYFISSPGYEDEVTDNTLTYEGLNYLLECGLRGAPQLSEFYIALFTNNYTPTAALKASNFAATAGEITSATEGYSEATRPVWTPNPAVDGVMDSVGNLCHYTIATTSSVMIRGAAMLSDSPKGATTGKLISAARFDNDREHFNGDVFTTGYRVSLRLE